MMWLGTLLPLLFIGLIILVIVNLKKKKLYLSNMKGSHVRILFLGYVIFLVLSVGLFYLMPVEGMITETKSSTIIEDLNEEQEDFNDAIRQGNIKHLDEVYFSKNWTFPYQGGPIEYEQYSQDIHFIVAQKKDTEEIKVDYYTTRTIIDEIDFTKELPVPTVVKHENKLLLVQPESYQLDVTKFDQEFTINQFTKGQNQGQKHSSQWGTNALVITIPLEAELEYGDDVHISFIK
ncbi:hypothetical protein [Bacillus solitudinis]|uniref:hypothetical protein n=1 Tax=Bacillus solitudinis TaxID=2014074 RepID=UPI000C23BA45|nr:hypothetical protein [Bacillus solitudinis]